MLMYRSSGCMSVDLNWWFAVFVLSSLGLAGFSNGISAQIRMPTVAFVSVCLFITSHHNASRCSVLNYTFIKDFVYIKLRNVAVNIFERPSYHGVVVVSNFKLGLFLLF